MNNQIKVRYTNVYGRIKIYIISEQAQAIAKLTGQKCLYPPQIEALQELGFVFVNLLQDKPVLEPGKSIIPEPDKPVRDRVAPVPDAVAESKEEFERALKEATGL